MKTTSSGWFLWCVRGMKHMEKQENALDMKIAREMVDSFVCSTGVSCLLIDEEGGELYRREPEQPLFSECCRIMGDLACRKLHRFGADEAERLGGRYLYFCPMGMGCIASPVILEGKLSGALVAGPVRVMELEDHLLCTPALRDLAAGEGQVAVTELLEKFPRREPDVLSHLSAMLCSTALYIGGESRSRMEQRQADLQRENERAREQAPEPEPVRILYPLDKEQALTRAVTEGDLSEVRILLEDLVRYMIFSTGGDFMTMRARSLELITMLSRAAADGGADVEKVLEMNQQFQRESDYLRSTEELTTWLNRIAECYTALVFNLVNVKHKDIIYKALNYIKRSYSGKLTLEDTAHYVGFSPAYFSKVFKEEMGVTFNRYLGNLRVEHSKKLLLFSTLSLNEICSAVGFEDQSYYVKVFRRYTGMTPGRYRKQQGLLDSGRSSRLIASGS